jgi:hypothetical protein
MNSPQPERRSPDAPGRIACVKEPMDVPVGVVRTGIAFSFVGWGLVTAWYIWPALRRLPHADALRPLLLLHGFRFIGLAFLPGVVSPDLPAAFASPAAHGGLMAAVLALLALAALPSRLGFALTWAFNLWGTADLLYAFYQGNHVGLEPGQLGAAHFIVTILVPMLLITHGLVFRLLLRVDPAAAGRNVERAA